MPTEERTAPTLVLPDAPPALAETLASGGAVAWDEPLVIRTYEAGRPSEYPMYLDHRVYQGSSGRVYPLPFVEDVARDGHDRPWQAVHLENRYVRLVVLPELGGRIHIGYDKSTDYDFFYRNTVIKPALVGLGGPWISGGVELNWPQHHRPATYLSVETTIEYAADGSVTVWCHDHDPFDRMSAQHGVRLHADRSVVELVVRLHNRTSERQSFLWWANVAARSDGDYQAFFPQDVRYVADHARRAITAFPAADRAYYGVDYPALAAQTPGADRIDFYRNIPVPTSYMVVDSQQDFFGGYDHRAGAGFVHWAERRISPGKKMWTWGDAPFGHAWDAHLTDDDGPYVELMAGVYTDNQPDFSWLLPGETKVFTQYWYPIPGIGPAHQATPDAAVNIEAAADAAGGMTFTATFAVTAPQPGAQLRILRGDEVVAARTADLVPGEVEVVAVGDRDDLGGRAGLGAVDAQDDADADADADGALRAELRDRTGKLLVAWAPTAADATGSTGSTDAEPPVAEEPPPASQMESVEELYLTGVHLDQYRHPTRSPMTYWTEALRRDPGDVRTNLALADRAYRSGEYERALEHTQTALARLTRRNANPRDAEGFYLAGLVLQRLGRHVEAEQAFGKAGWDATWAGAAGFELARSLARAGKNRAALRVLDSLDDVVGHDARRSALGVLVLRRLGRHDEAQTALERALARDPLDATLRSLADPGAVTEAGIAVDVALDLAKAGEPDAALAMLAVAAAADIAPAGNVRPLAHYHAAVILDGLGRPGEAAGYRARAQGADLTWAFPAGLDSHDALVQAILADPGDAVAHFLLGMLLYAHGRRLAAVAHWDEAIDLGLDHPVLLRNAALGAAVTGDDERALDRYAQAIALAPADARLRYEADQLAARVGHPGAERLGRLRGVEDLVLTRDDLTIEYVGLLVADGDAERAHQILLSRPFRPWEGGEGKALAAWDATIAALGRPLTDPPPSLGEVRPRYTAPAPVRGDGTTDYFATSLPELLLFSREMPS